MHSGVGALDRTDSIHRGAPAADVRSHNTPECSSILPSIYMVKVLTSSCSDRVQRHFVAFRISCHPGHRRAAAKAGRKEGPVSEQQRN